MIPFRLRACATQRLLWTSLCAVALVGCGSNVKLDDNAPPVESRSGTAVNPDGSGGASSGATSQSQVTPVDLTKGAGAGSDAANAANRTVYFDFDSYVVRDDARPVIDANAKLLAANKTKKMSAEGHTDERGGREYNLALGQKRAEAVVRALTLSGAADGQVEAVSFGKERPAVTGSDEAAYAKNRRVELVNR
ncbi:MAG: peptidoglycan-associated lipoprotein Pal [Pseudomonadota bacterium]|nr:peptidoglycan-associated lipoprotein Pal [Pseudomonadota bacterium]